MRVPRVDAAMVLQVQAAVLAQSSFLAAATAFASQLAPLFDSARVCLGMLEHGSVAIVALSNAADFQRNSEHLRIVTAAMDEAIEQGVSISYPVTPGARPRITLAHAELARRGAANLATVPLVSAGRLIGAVTLEQHAGDAFSAEAVRTCERLLALIAPVLELKRNADRPWHVQLHVALLKASAGPRQVLLSASAIGLAALVFGLGFWPVEYRVSAPAHVEGAIQRALVAPADGYLGQVYVKPGDAVVAEQVLADLADQDLELERRKWASELAQQENSYRAALAKGDRTQFVVSTGKADSARVQLEVAQQQIRRSHILAPFDGTIIKGDLSQALGAPVQRGDILLTVAPTNAYRLIVEVDERDIADVKLGSHGVLALAALPDVAFGFQVARVTPMATSKDGRNYFEVEGQLGATPQALRPGLQGVAKIVSGERSLAWIWTHRFVDWARLAIWSFGA